MATVVTRLRMVPRGSPVTTLSRGARRIAHGRQEPKNRASHRSNLPLHIMRVLAVAAALPMVAAVVTIGGGKTPNADASENAETWLSRTVLFVSNLHATDSLAGDKLRLFTAMSVYVMQLHFIHAYGVNGTIDCGRFREGSPTRVYACAAYAFAKVKTERPQANGFIFMHSDFFVSQPFFSGVSKLDVDQLWHAGWATPKLPSETKYIGLKTFTRYAPHCKHFQQ